MIFKYAVLDLDLTQGSLGGAGTLGQFVQNKPEPDPPRSSSGFDAALAAGPTVPVKLVVINGAATQRNTISPLLYTAHLTFGDPCKVCGLAVTLLETQVPQTLLKTDFLPTTLPSKSDKD